MNYYFINSEDGQILESSEYTNRKKIVEDCQVWANDINCEVWVIKGEHSGVSCEPAEEATIPSGNPTIDDAKELGFSTFEDYKKAYAIEAAKLEHWKKHGTLAGFTLKTVLHNPQKSL